MFFQLHDITKNCATPLGPDISADLSTRMEEPFMASNKITERASLVALVIFSFIFSCFSCMLYSACILSVGTRISFYRSARNGRPHAQNQPFPPQIEHNPVSGGCQEDEDFPHFFTSQRVSAGSRAGPGVRGTASIPGSDCRDCQGSYNIYPLGSSKSYPPAHV